MGPGNYRDDTSAGTGSAAFVSTTAHRFWGSDDYDVTGEIVEYCEPEFPIIEIIEEPEVSGVLEFLDELRRDLDRACALAPTLVPGLDKNLESSAFFWERRRMMPCQRVGPAGGAF